MMNYAYNKLALEWTRNLMISDFVKPNHESRENGKRIYISRGKASRRRLINENKVLEKLCKEGFKSYFLEDMSIEQQVKLFSEAEAVVAPHGAGLVNIIFCRRAIRILELFPEWVSPALTNLAYQDIGRELGHACGYIMGKNVTAETGDERRNADFKINLKDFEIVFPSLLNG